MRARGLMLLLTLSSLVCLSLGSAVAGSRTWVDALARLGSRVEAAGQSASGCETTAKLARKACRHEVREELFTQLGACQNESDPDDAAECEAEADEIANEERPACFERYAARVEFCEMLEEELFDPEIDPDAFVSVEEMAADPNPYFPLVPGNEWVYENEEEIITVTVTGETVEIMDVTCIVVRDVVTLKEGDDYVEDTDDWYAQDEDGNVWYFGEISRNFEDGQLVDLDGSWKTGEDYAKPGIVMPADPFPGLVYRQEFLLREAEDGAEVVSITADESSEYADCDNDCLQTLEFTPIEPDVAEHKFYKPDLGLILEVDLEEGDRTELVGFSSNP